MNPLNLTQALARLLHPHPMRREDLSAYLDNRLAPSERGRVEEHLGACGRCRQELEELRVVVRALQGLSDVPVPRSFRLSPAQVGAAPAVARPTWAYGALGGAAAAAAVLFAVLLGGDLLTLESRQIVPTGGPTGLFEAPQREEAVEAGEGLPGEADLTVKEALPPEPTLEATATPPALPPPATEMPTEARAPVPPTMEATPPAVSPPATEAATETPAPTMPTEVPAEAYAPALPTQPPEAERAGRPAVAGEEGGGTGRIALRVGEAAAAAVALAALGGLLVLWRRRTET